MSLIYCYGVIEGKEGFSITGLESGKLHIISFKDISAVVNDVDEEEFSQDVLDKNVKNMKWLAEHAPQHEKVVDAVREKTTIVPMKFCTIFKNKERLREMLEEKYADLKENLERLNGKVEMGVKVYADFNILKKHIDSEEIRQLEKEKIGKKPGAAYFVQQKIDVLVDEKVRQLISGTTDAIFKRAGALAADHRKKLSREKDNVLNAVFLVSAKDADNFNRAVSELQREFPSLTLKVTGPFTPYHFVR